MGCITAVLFITIVYVVFALGAYIASLIFDGSYVFIALGGIIALIYLFRALFKKDSWEK